MLDLDEGATKRSIPIVCPSCRDLVTVDGDLEDVRPGDAISAFCTSCEHAIEVAAPVGIDAVDGRADEVAPVVSEFAPQTPST